MAAAVCARILRETDPFRVVGVQRGATPHEVARAFKRAALLVHPDKCELPCSAEAFAQLNNAHEACERECARAKRTHDDDDADNAASAPAPPPAKRARHRDDDAPDEVCCALCREPTPRDRARRHGTRAFCEPCFGDAVGDCAVCGAYGEFWPSDASGFCQRCFLAGLRREERAEASRAGRLRAAEARLRWQREGARARMASGTWQGKSFSWVRQHAPDYCRSLLRAAWRAPAGLAGNRAQLKAWLASEPPPE